MKVCLCKQNLVCWPSVGPQDIKHKHTDIQTHVCVTASHMTIVTVTAQTHVLVGMRSQLRAFRRNCLRPLLLDHCPVAGCCRQDMIYKRLFNGNVMLRSLCGMPPHPLHAATAATAVAEHLHQGDLPPNRLWDIAHVLKQHAQCMVEASVAASARASASASSPAAGLPAATTERQDAGEEDDRPAETGPAKLGHASTDVATAATGECVVQYADRRVFINLPQQLAHHIEAWLTPVL